MDLSSLRVFANLEPGQLAEMATQAKNILGEDVYAWELAGNLAHRWPGGFDELLSSVRSLRTSQQELER